MRNKRPPRDMHITLGRRSHPPPPLRAHAVRFRSIRRRRRSSFPLRRRRRANAADYGGRQGGTILKQRGWVIFPFKLPCPPNNFWGTISLEIADCTLTFAHPCTERARVSALSLSLSNSVTLSVSILSQLQLAPLLLSTLSAGARAEPTAL